MQKSYCKYFAVAALALFTVAPMSAKTSSATSLKQEMRKDHYTINGRIIDAKTHKPLQYAQVLVLDSSLGSVTDPNGEFVIKSVPRDKVRLRVKFVGYNTAEYVVDRTNPTVTLKLVPSAFNVDEVVVSANRTETRRRLAPVMVNVTGQRLFNATSSVDLDQALKFNPGVRVEDNCQNCGFNQVRINGLDGSYSQIIINSRPIFSALAGVYALEMLPTEMIDHVEVVRGGGSVLFGSSAIGGTVNVITKTPTHNSASISYNNELFQDNFDKPGHNFNGYASIVTPDHQAGIAVFGRMKIRPGIDLVRKDSKIPADKTLGTKAGQDGFTDIPRLFSSTVGTSAFLNFSPESKLSLDYFYTQEERRGGNNLNRPEHEAAIAESLRHRIHTGVLKFDQYLFDGAGYLSAFVGGSSTIRNSYYGGGPLTAKNLTSGYSEVVPEQGQNESQDDFNRRVDEWRAKRGTLTNGDLYDDSKALEEYGYTNQSIVQYGVQYVHNFDHLLFMPAELTLGVEAAHNSLNDASGYRTADIYQKTHTTSVFAQNEWKNETLGFLLGGRFDHVSLHSDAEESSLGLKKLNIFTPRATFRYNPMESLTFRFSYAEGFRAPGFFDEDLHVAFAQGEGKPRILDPKLKEERSRSLTLSSDYYIDLSDNWKLNLMAEGFYTRLLNKFTPVDSMVTIPGKTEQKPVFFVRNASGATVYGLNTEARLAYQRIFSLQAGMTFQRNYFDEAEEVYSDVPATKDFMRTPNTYGYFVMTYNPTEQLALNLSGDYTGKMKVPHDAGDIVYYNDDKTKPYISQPENSIETAKAFFTLNAKVAYKFKVNGTGVELNAGINNIFNAYQPDFDEGPNRASAYIYGPKTPRYLFSGIKFSL